MTKQKMAVAPDKGKRPKVTHYGNIELLPGANFECAVLEDGRRGFIQRQMLQSIGFAANNPRNRFERFCAKIGIQPPEKVDEIGVTGLEVDMPHGGSASWVPCEVLTDVVRAGMIAYGGGKLTAQQAHIGKRCVSLGTALIGVGLTSLIDEATGYQYAREPAALQDLFGRLIRQTAKDWERRFHPEFYRAVCGLFGIQYGNRHRALPSVIGQITERFVYLPVFPKEIVAEIKARKNSETLHQWLTDDCGLRLLEKQINDVTAIARSSVDYKDFEARCSQAFYKPGQQLSMIYPQGNA